ncbi:DUF5121 domain-containing protein [Segatella baroniae]|uniref:DUF5121 domain-containing protein n=1 Tax=Segatella baroniae TaxID=305719 RepID=UPI00277D0804|nr:DUF5121 domain-containing protein [Segatella baroniae]
MRPARSPRRWPTTARAPSGSSATPSMASDDGRRAGWWTDTDHALCLAPVKPKVHQVTLTVGKQLKAGKSVNFKFFGQAGWGTEFKGKDHDHLLTTDNPTFLIGNGTGGHDNGNIYLPTARNWSRATPMSSPSTAARA